MKVHPFLQRTEEIIDFSKWTLRTTGRADIASEQVKVAVEYLKRVHGNQREKSALKRQFCRKCYSPFIEGITVRRRVRNRILIVTCLSCGYVRRYPIVVCEGEERLSD